MVKRQNNVIINKRYDLLIYGLPNLTPYSVNSNMNPILFHTVVNGYSYNLYNNKPLLKDKGIIIVQNHYMRHLMKNNTPHTSIYTLVTFLKVEPAMRS